MTMPPSAAGRAGVTRSGMAADLAGALPASLILPRSALTATSVVVLTMPAAATSKRPLADAPATRLPTMEPGSDQRPPLTKFRPAFFDIVQKPAPLEASDT